MAFDWKAMVGNVAPVLGTALGGPFGGMAGKFIADALGTTLQELPDVILNATPDQMMKIKNADQEFKMRMRELDISEEQLNQKDRDSARELAKSTALTPQVIISSIFIIGFVIVLYSVFSGKASLTDMQQQMANILIGILSAGIVQVMNFWFGSSAGSKEKTNLMSNKA